MTNEYLVETLHHFTCPSCRRDGCVWSVAMEETSRTEWYCPWCGDSTDDIKAINQDVLHDTDIAKYRQIDWIEQIRATVTYTDTADNIKARSLAIEEYVKGYHGA